jgi:hypothetical protein
MAGLTFKAALTQSDTTRAEVGRYFRVNCTVAGDVKVTTPSGDDVYTVAVGTSFFPVAVIRVWTTGTTATGTYANYA